MPLAKKSRLGDTSRGVAAAADSHRTTFMVPDGARLAGVLVSARPNLGGPTAAQQQGFVRVTAYVGEDQAMNLRPLLDPLSTPKGGALLLDHDVGMCYSNAPQWLPLGDFKLPRGESLTVEVSQFAASDGGINDTLASVVLLGSEPGEEVERSL